MARRKRPPFPAPPGKKWRAIAHFYHKRAKRRLYARNYGKECFWILVKA